MAACFLFLILSLLPLHSQEQRHLLLVVGAAGEEEFGERFSTSAALWQKAAAQAGFKITTVGLDEAGEPGDKTRLLDYLAAAATNSPDEQWIAMIGHGTFDGRSAKLNLRGPDIAVDELSVALKPFVRPLAIIQCSSASGPFLNALSGSNRVVITATRSGHEINATRFGDYFAQAIADPAADLDKDGQTSLLESFLMASRQVQQFYKEEGRLATEHALLDDNGDGLGTQADWFRGVRAVKTAQGGESVDGVRAHQMNLVRSAVERDLSPEVRARRDELERKLSTLRSQKATLEESEYYNSLESILVELARLYQSNAVPIEPVTATPTP